MTWAARGGRAGVLSALAVGWGLLAHLRAVGHDEATRASVGALLWAACATLLLTWFLVPPRRDGGRPGGAARMLLAVGAGQGLTHAALALSPLLADGSRRLVGPGGTDGTTGHAGHLPVVLTGAPGPTELLTALGHGGLPMLLLHALATTTVVVLWTAAGSLWREAGAWWGRLVDTGPARVPAPPRRSATHREDLAGGGTPRRAWDGRAPPTPAAP